MKKQVNASGLRYTNWNCDVDGDTPPPVILNPETTTHNAIAWAWGEVDALHDLCMMTLASNDERAPIVMMDQFAGRLDAIRNVLEALGGRTRPGKRDSEA